MTGEERGEAGVREMVLWALSYGEYGGEGADDV